MDDRLGLVTGGGSILWAIITAMKGFNLTLQKKIDVDDKEADRDEAGRTRDNLGLIMLVERLQKDLDAQERRLNEVEETNRAQGTTISQLHMLVESLRDANKALLERVDLLQVRADRADHLEELIASIQSERDALRKQLEGKMPS
jgi:predicted RNase H-like nuclease (RuvC/YqgF family)